MVVSSQSHVSVALPQNETCSDIRWLGIWVGSAADLDVLEEIIKFMHIFENETTIPHLAFRNLITTPTKLVQLHFL